MTEREREALEQLIGAVDMLMRVTPKHAADLAGIQALIDKSIATQALQTKATERLADVLVELDKRVAKLEAARGESILDAVLR